MSQYGCVSAIYLQHHYVTDVLLGSVCASVALAAVTVLDRRAPGGFDHRRRLEPDPRATM